MMLHKHVLFLIGSPKKSNSTSHSICSYLSYLLEKKNISTRTLHILTLLKSEEGRKKIFASLEQSDVIVFCSPLYVDTLPYFVLEAMELISGERRKIKMPQEQKLLAISNCGFPEASQNDIALRTYRHFASEAKFVWMGGIAFGMGVAVNGLSMKKIGLVFPNIRRSFELIANDIATRDYIRSDAIRLAAKSFMPKWLYIWLGNNITWRFLAIKNGAWNMTAAPYQCD